MAKKPKKEPPTRQQLLAEAIAACEDDTGRATPKTVVDAARDPDSVLHGEFEWNDTIAARLQREGRARELIREVKVITIYGNRRLATPIYVIDPRTADHCYARTVEVAKSASAKVEVLKAETDRIASAIRRALALAVAFDLEDHFEAALAEIMAAAAALEDA